MAKKSTRRPIWIDFDNSPHVVFFKPIIEELEKRGYPTVLSARDCFQVCGLAERSNLSYARLGRHYGKNKALKVVGLFVRALMLIPFAIKHRPVLTVSHGSRSQLLVSKLLGIPSIMLFDYEHTADLPLVHPTWSIAPEVVLQNGTGNKRGRMLSYPGIKEDVYVPEFTPDPGIKDELNFDDTDLVITIRPPATEAHYHVSSSEDLFEEAVAYLADKPNIRMVILPRSKKQDADIRQRWAQLVKERKIVIPDKVVDGLNMIWYSDLVISGGGTMNREAAAMGVPVYSIFRGKTGAVDRYLENEGRLIFIKDMQDLKTKLKLVKWQRPDKPGNASRNTLNSIADHIIDIFEGVDGRKG